MECLVTYDVNTETPEGERRLRRVAKICEGFGHRVQKSVFECILTPGDFLRLHAALSEAISPAVDSVLVYRLREPFAKHVSRLGVGAAFDQRSPFVL